MMSNLDMGRIIPLALAVILLLAGVVFLLLRAF
jgi:hypothetical protein